MIDSIGVHECDGRRVRKGGLITIRKKDLCRRLNAKNGVDFVDCKISE